MTGASRGIGKGVAIALCKRGATVYITGRTMTSASEGVQALGSLTQTAAEAARGGGRCIPVSCDHASDISTEAMFAQVRRDEGRLDCLVNNAFGGADVVQLAGKKFFEKPIAVWDAAHTVGLRSHYICSVYAAKLMLETPSQPTRLIVNISSAAGLGYFYDVAYGVGKAGVDRLAADMANELRDYNIACLSLWPGAVRTEYLLQQGSAIGGMKFKDEDMESPEFTGIAIAALLTDPQLLSKSGRVLQSAEAAAEYGFIDTDGSPKMPLVPTTLVDMSLPNMRAAAERKRKQNRPKL